jgi:hypothetical protein
MTTVRIKRRKPPEEETPEEETVVTDFSKPNTEPWSPAKLYGRSEDYKRVLFLELMAWAIYSMETIDTRREWESFTKELVDTRERVWGARPWSNATDNDTFLKHVQHMANVFANADVKTGVKYDRRKTKPLPAAS